MRAREKLQTRGYWLFTVRPLPYEAERIPSFEELEAIIDRTSVRLRGWDFPHISRHDPIERFESWIEQSTDWKHYVESWRLYKSGQFAYWRGIGDDWRDQSSLWPRRSGEPEVPRLGVGDVMYLMAEFATFAGRLAVSPAGADQIHLRAALHGAEGRTLWLEDRARVPFSYARTASVGTVAAVNRVIDREEVAGDVRELAIAWSRRVFELFRWDTGDEVLGRLYEDVAQRR